MTDRKLPTVVGNVRALDNLDDTFTVLLGLRQAANSTTVTIASGTAPSSAVDTRGYGPRGVAVETPAAWTAADIGFEVSADDSTYYKLYDDVGTRVKISGVGTATAGLYMAPAETWALGSYQYFRLVSINTSTGADENQGGARTLKVKMLA